MGATVEEKRGTTHLSRKFVKFANIHKVTRHITNLCRHEDFKTSSTFNNTIQELC
jgi:hypothetical protein